MDEFPAVVFLHVFVQVDGIVAGDLAVFISDQMNFTKKKKKKSETYITLDAPQQKARDNRTKEDGHDQRVDQAERMNLRIVYTKVVIPSRRPRRRRFLPVDAELGVSNCRCRVGKKKGLTCTCSRLYSSRLLLRSAPKDPQRYYISVRKRCYRVFLCSTHRKY